MEARHVASGAHATAAGTIAIVDNGPRLDLKGSWEQFRWPLDGPRSRGAQRRAVPSPCRACCPTACTSAGTCARCGSAADAGGRRRHARQGRLRLRARRGRPVRGSCQRQRAGYLGAARRPGTSAATRAGINPGALRADLPGSLSFDYSSCRTRLRRRAARFSAAFSDLSGKLRGATAGGSGTVRARRQDLVL